MEIPTPSPPIGATHLHRPSGIGFAEAQRRFQEQFGPPVGGAGVPKQPSEPMQSRHGCLNCLHHHVRAAMAAKNHLLFSLTEAKKYADELASKQLDQTEATAQVASSLAKVLQVIEPVDLVSIANDIPEVTGPGTELHKLLAELGFNEPPGCSCQATMAWMNEIGMEGCRQQIDTIIEKLREAQTLVGWVDLAKGTWQALKNFKAMKLSVLHPVRSLVEEAIRRAEEKNRSNDSAAKTVSKH